MDEFLNVWDSSGYRTDKIVSKDYVHQNGLFHATVHVWFFVKDCEFQHVFLCKLTQPFQSLKMQDSEIDDLRLFSFDEIKECILGNHPKINLVPADMNYYSYVIDEVKKELRSF